jgi:membrane-bound serine protease (ClpP class)
MKISYPIRILFSILLAGVLTSFITSEQNFPEEAEAKKTLVYKFDIRTEIGPPIWRETQKSFEEAMALNADLILIHMNTYGGLVQAADSIRTKILNSPVPVIIFVDNNAISAGALIAIAADKIYMRKGASIGAATVVSGTGEVVPDKYQSFMRSTMRATAESHGKDTIITDNDTIIRWKRDPNIAEAMVDPAISIPGVIEEGKVLTFTTEEAIRNHYCEGEAESIFEVLELEGIENYTLSEFTPTVIDSIIGFLISPLVHGLLIMVIVFGIYFELQTPGVGFPLAAAVVAAILYFAPLYLEGIAQNWEILLFIVGVILLLVEIFAIPGFGVAGIAGIILIVTGLALAMVDNIVFEFEGQGLQPVMKAFFIVTISATIALISSIYISSKILSVGPFARLVLDSKQDKGEGFIGIDFHMNELVGKIGVAHTSLRPSGKIEIDQEVYDAKALHGFIQKDEPVKVVRFETGQLYVVKNA